MHAITQANRLDTVRLAVVLPYFGKLPATWFLTEQSLRANTFIDWHIMTDQDVKAYGNVFVHQYTFEEFRVEVSAKLGFPLALEKPYKICDLRPMFGYVFSDLLRNYDYWGYCDADVIFGDLEKWVAHGIESGMPKIFQRGHLSLLKNIDEVNFLFLRSKRQPNYRSVLSNPDNFLFDEAGGFYGMLLDAGLQTYEDNMLFDIEPRLFRPRATTSSAKRPIYIYRDGALFELDQRDESYTREGRYIHFQKRPYTAGSNVLELSQFKYGCAAWFAPTELIQVQLGSQTNHRFGSRSLIKDYFGWMLFHIRRKLRNQNTVLRLRGQRLTKTD